MKLIVGLGNPGDKYKNNRHNVGFMFVDFLLEKLKERYSLNNLQHIWKFDKYSDTELLKINLHPTPHSLYPIVLAKPQTYMNKSGQAVKKLLTTHNSQPTTLYVVHDDLDIPLGKFKIQQGSGPQLHNGIISIEESLKTRDFWRIRIGIDNRNPDQKISGEAYVLQDFTGNELEILQNTFTTILNRLLLEFK